MVAEISGHFRLSKNLTQNSLKNQARRRVRRACIFPERKRRENNTFSQEIARKILREGFSPTRNEQIANLPFRSCSCEADAADRDFQISADFFQRNENPQIFIASVKKSFLTRAYNPMVMNW